MQKIIISSYDDLGNPTYAGGGAVAVTAVAEKISNHYQITVLTGTYQGAKDEIKKGVKYVRIGTSRFGDRAGQFIYQLLLPYYAKQLDYDLWIESFTPPFSTAFLPLFTKKPVIGLVHMLAASDMERKYKLPFSLVENLGLKVYKHFITLSESSRQEIMRKNDDANFAVVSNGVVLPKLTQTYSKRETDYLLYMGRIEVDQKGLDLLLGAYKKILNPSTPDLKIAGTGSDSEIVLLKRLIENLGLSSHVELIGRVSGTTKHKLMLGALGMLIPSRFETFSLTALESLSYGIPLVCFDIPGMAWVPSNLSLKAKAFSVNSFAKHMKTLLTNKKLAAQLSRMSLSVSKQYTWDSVVKKYLTFIQGII